MFEVEDHGNGFMVIGTDSIVEARAELGDYVDDAHLYVYACPTHYEGRSAVWLSTEPGAQWDGATDGAGNPVR